MTGLVLGMSVATVATTLTGAIFIDSQSVGANTFSAGTLDISSSPSSAVVSLSDMAPGDKVTAPLTVSNAGSLQLRYALTSTTTENTLAAQLDVTVKTGVSTCNTSGFGVDGTTLYGPADLGSTTGLNVLGNPSQGAQTGDRTVAASGSEVLCIQVELPLGTGNSYQGLSTTATLVTAAEQTTNN